MLPNFFLITCWQLIKINEFKIIIIRVDTSGNILRAFCHLYQPAHSSAVAALCGALAVLSLHLHGRHNGPLILEADWSDDGGAVGAAGAPPFQGKRVGRAVEASPVARNAGRGLFVASQYWWVQPAAL